MAAVCVTDKLLMYYAPNSEESFIVFNLILLITKFLMQNDLTEYDSPVKCSDIKKQL